MNKITAALQKPTHLKSCLTGIAALSTAFLLTSCTTDEVDAFGHGMDVGSHIGGGDHVYHHDDDE